MKNFISFNKMITPTIIKVLFWVGVGFSIILGLLQIIAGFDSYFGGGYQIFMGILTIILGPIFTRVYCELLILFFKMHETIQEINEKLGLKDN
ncbi:MULTISPECIES: DUF4282 domain-containing protein [Oceanobacillus]|uniref:DUF4282 domain-containing protein n=1 Tax=Oceanobacillus TaxID=182709 RepID=UPI0019593EF7